MDGDTIIKSKSYNSKHIAVRWKQQYYKSTGWTSTASHASTEGVYLELLKLPHNCTREDVDKTIGNQSWTHILCDECTEYVETVASFGQEKDINICEQCLRSSVAAFSNLRRKSYDGC